MKKQPTKRTCKHCNQEYKIGASNGQPKLYRTGVCSACDNTIPDHLRPRQYTKKTDLPKDFG